MRSEVFIPYIWAATGLVTLVFVVLGVYWAHNHGQFNEDISKQIFTDGDDERYDK